MREFFDSLIKIDRKNLYCCMARENNKNTLDYIRLLKKYGYIEKTGLSIYFPHELDPNINITFIPNSVTFADELQKITLYSDLYVRSMFNYIPKDKRNLDDINELIKFYKQFERKDLQHSVEFVVGVSNLEQLKINLGLFK
jgi:hypothetical protein